MWLRGPKLKQQHRESVFPALTSFRCFPDSAPGGLHLARGMQRHLLQNILWYLPPLKVLRGTASEGYSLERLCITVQYLRSRPWRSVRR